MGKSKYWSYIFCGLFGVYVAAVLWITLLSRIGTGYRGFLFPFRSYVEIVKGNIGFLIENIENVILCVPLGIFISCMKKWNLRRVAVIGLCISLSIEILQAIFALGTFECDDLLHNTVGTVIGYCLVEKNDVQVSFKREAVVVTLVALIVFTSLPFGYQRIQNQYMVKLAALHDREEGSKNLLILNGKTLFDWSCDVFIDINNNGAVCVSGQTNAEIWKVLADLQLEPGRYISELECDYSDYRVKIYIAPYNSLKKDYELTKYLSNNSVYCFEIKERTKCRVYLFIDKGFDIYYCFLPTLYKVDE